MLVEDGRENDAYLLAEGIHLASQACLTCSRSSLSAAGHSLRHSRSLRQRVAKHWRDRTPKVFVFVCSAREQQRATGFVL